MYSGGMLALRFDINGSYCPYIWKPTNRPKKIKNKDKTEILGVWCEAQTTKNRFTNPYRKVTFPLMFDWGVDDKKSIYDIGKETNELAEKCRNRTIDLMDLRGGSFTITNIGSIGGTFAIPIINLS
jgi:hypothetical protein